MIKHKQDTSLANNSSGFTLIELIIVIGLFGIVSAVLMNSLLSVYHFRDVIRYKKDINFEASSVLNNGIPGLIRSGFAINYDETNSEKSHAMIERKQNDPDLISEGMQNETDQISIYTDRAEKQYFTIYRKNYQNSGEYSDTAPLYIRFSNGDEFPLHSSEVVIEDFDVQIPSDPRIGGNKNIQPYVSLYLRLRKRYPFGEVVDESTLDSYKTVRASYQTTISLRNSNPASYKHLPKNI